MVSSISCEVRKGQLFSAKLGTGCYTGLERYWSNKPFSIFSVMVYNNLFRITKVCGNLLMPANRPEKKNSIRGDLNPPECSKAYPQVFFSRGLDNGWTIRASLPLLGSDEEVSFYEGQDCPEQFHKTSFHRSKFFHSFAAFAPDTWIKVLLVIRLTKSDTCYQPR